MTRPTILVDVRRNSWAPQYGISRYSRNLVRSIAALDVCDLTVRPLDIVGSQTWSEGEAVYVSPSGHGLVSRFRQEQFGMRRLGNPDLLHLPWYEGPVLAGVRHVVNIHDMDTLVARKTYGWKFRAYYNTLLRSYTRTAARVIVPSTATGEAVQARWPRLAIDVVPYGVDPVFTPRSPSEVRPGRILYTGGYGPRKRIDDLISAFDQIASAVATGELVMAGVPSTDAWNAINRSRHRRRIRVTGFVDDDQLAQLYRSAEVVAYPTLLEGFGFPVVEAFASGTPIVATRSGSIPEIARGAALLVEPGDARELAEAIRSVLDGNGLATSLSSAGLGRVAEYGWPRVALQTLDVYRKAIRG